MVEFRMPSTDHPMCLWVTANGKRESDTLQSVVSALCERYSPCSVFLHSDNTRLLYSSQFHGLRRAWASGGYGVWVEGTENRKAVGELCTLAQAMEGRVLVHRDANRLEFYETARFFRALHSMTRPFEFTSIREEFLYETGTASYKTVDTLTEAVDEYCAAIETRTLRDYYTEANATVKRMVTEHRELSFETRPIRTQYALTALVLPAVTLLTDPHPFRAAVLEAFVNGGGEYISKTTDFINGYGSVISDLQAKRGE